MPPRCLLACRYTHTHMTPHASLSPSLPANSSPAPSTLIIYPPSLPTSIHSCINPTPLHPPFSCLPPYSPRIGRHLPSPAASIATASKQPPRNIQHPAPHSAQHLTPHSALCNTASAQHQSPHPRLAPLFLSCGCLRTANPPAPALTHGELLQKNKYNRELAEIFREAQGWAEAMSLTADACRCHAPTPMFLTQHKHVTEAARAHQLAHS